MRLATFLALPAILRASLAYTALGRDSYTFFPAANEEDFDIHSGKLLAPILKPRVPGTQGSREVLQHFVDFFRNNLPDWRLEFQNSTSTTPLSDGQEVPFVNLIATRDPPWIDPDRDLGEVSRLALVAHYDSLAHPEGFIGAIDSAAPCAMLLHVAQSMNAALTKKWSTMSAEDAELDGSKGVQILLLDGEEAFQSWTATDSLYGARALAEEWDTAYFPATSTFQTPLHSIELFVLLDLLGSKNPSIPSYFKTTHWAYRNLAMVEQSLRGRFKLKSQTEAQRPFLHESDKTDKDRWLGGLIGDDHEPFLARGVEILHVIPNDFPPVWHRITDDGEHLDIPTVCDWATIISAFTAEWMDLEGFIGLDRPQGGGRRHLGEDEKTEL